MKTQYFHVISNVNGLLCAKGKTPAAYVIDPAMLRKHGKGYLSMKEAEAARKPFHIGIVKVSDKAATFFD